MRLNPKYFNLFIFVVALVAIVWIAYGTMSYKDTQIERYWSYINEYDSLQIAPLALILEDDSISISDFEGEDVLIQFWATWSDKSQLMMQEIESSAYLDSVVLIKALVKDDIDAFRNSNPDSAIHINGTPLYNRIRTPGMPSYLLFDKKGEIVSLGVGYSEGAITEALKAHINE